MADNATTLADQDGFYADWIEITNPDGSAVNLAGYFLTDNLAAKTKWAFPSHSLATGASLVVFASSKNRAVAGAQLHTNFQLSKTSGTVALIAPDGTTVVSSFAYGAQKEDVSYGVARETTSTDLVAGSSQKIWIPSGGTAPDAAWKNASYSPTAGWLNGSAPPAVGYDTTAPAGTIVNLSTGALATMTTTLWPQTANLAIDLPVGTFARSAVTDVAPELTVDIGAPAALSNVVITNTTTNASRLRDITVEVLDAENAVVYTSPVLNAGNTGFTYPAGPATLSVDFVSLTGSTILGRKVRISRAADTALAATGGQGGDEERYVLGVANVAINGVPTLSNLARTGIPAPTAVQTTTNGAFAAGLAIDGNLTNFTHTLSTDLSSTWTLNLNRMAAIHRVDIHNRENCCLERLRDIRVTLLAADGTTVLHTSPLLNERNHLFSPGDINYDVAAENGNTPVVAQFVRINRAADTYTAVQDTTNDDLRVLSLGEVQVRGTDLSSYRPYIRTDLQTALQNVASTAYIRIPFSVTNPALSALAMDIRYDDGFVATLNGVEVATRNAPSSQDASSVATASRTASEGVVAESIDLSAHLGLLVAGGQNVLAIHGLNSSASDTDFLIQPRLLATTAVLSPPAFLEVATPGAANGSDWVLGEVADTVFSHRRGFYDATFSLGITTPTPGAQIYYTLDNSEPTPTNGAQYVGPITINKTSVVRARAFATHYTPTNIDTHTYLFLADVTTPAKGTLTTAGAVGGNVDGAVGTAIPPGWPTSSQTNGAQEFNFGFNQAVMTGYTPQQIREGLTQIPSISIVTQQNNLTSPTTGIYVNGTTGHGFNWEKPASVELLDITKPGLTPQEGHGEFGENCGLRLRGGASRGDGYTKHSFRVFFRDGYGNGKLNYRLYGNEGASSFDTFDLRASQNYSWSNGNNDAQETLVRDPFCRSLLGAMGQPYTRSKFAHVYLNGLYWGIMEIHERPENSFGETYLGGNKDNYDVVKNHDRYVVQNAAAFSTEATDGYLLTNPDNSKAAWKDLWDRSLALWQNRPVGNADYYRILGRNPDGTRNPAYRVLIDIDNLIDYTMALFYTGDGDACLSGFLGFNTPNNWHGMRDRLGERGFVFFNHDAEHTLRASSWSGSRAVAATDQTGPFGGSNQTNFNFSNPQWMHEQFMAASPEYRLRYADRIRKHLFNNGALTPTTTRANWNARVAPLTKAIVPYAGRWANAATVLPVWERLVGIAPNAAGIIDHIPDDFLSTRTAALLQMLKNDGLYPQTEAPDFSQHGGAVPGGYGLTLSSPTPGTHIYYTTDGTDPRLILAMPATPLTLLASTATGRYKITTAETDGYTLNPPAPAPTPGPIGRWTLNGNTNDTGSGLNAAGVLVGAPTYTSPGPSGQAQALTLNGTSQSVNLNNPTNLQITGQLTLAAWIRPTAFPTGQANIINKGHNLTPNGEITLRLEAGNTLTIGTWNGTTFGASATGVCVLNEWQFVCGLYDGTNWRLYRNGVQVAATASTTGAVSVAGTAAANNNWSLGSRGGGTERFFAGSMADARIYNRGLTAAEVQNLYLGEVSTYSPQWHTLAYSVPEDWATGSGTFGFDVNGGTDFTPVITTAVSAMQNNTASLLARKEFTLTAADIAQINYLQLNMTYDDGFVVYLNGVKLGERNAPAQPTILHGKATATAALTDDAAALTPLKINITAQGKPLLIAGTNVLAIQGMNSSAADGDFLLGAELVAGSASTPNVTSTAQLQGGPVTLTQSTTIKARSFNPATGEWSAITEAFFSVATTPASTANLVISEIQYHPAIPQPGAEATVSTNPDDFEFLELMNISSGNIDLTGAAFTAGIQFTFGNSVLEPGQRVCLVRNEAAFRARYGSTPTVLGTYAGSLSNGGEQLLLAAAGGATIRDFQYDDAPPWPETTDGLGYSLTLIAPAINPNHGIATNWRPSDAVGGSAATASDSLTLAAWMAQENLPAGSDLLDSDGDGLSNISEYALGSNPKAPQTAAPWTTSQDGDGNLLIEIQHPVNRDDVAYELQLSGELMNWSEKATLQQQMHNFTEGTMTSIYRTETPWLSETRKFMRLQVIRRNP